MGTGHVDTMEVGHRGLWRWDMGRRGQNPGDTRPLGDKGMAGTTVSWDTVGTGMAGDTQPWRGTGDIPGRGGDTGQSVSPSLRVPVTLLPPSRAGAITGAPALPVPIKATVTRQGGGHGTGATGIAGDRDGDTPRPSWWPFTLEPTDNHQPMGSGGGPPPASPVSPASPASPQRRPLSRRGPAMSHASRPAVR